MHCGVTMNAFKMPFHILISVLLGLASYTVAAAKPDETKEIKTEAELLQYMQSSEVQKVLKPASENQDSNEELGPPVTNKNSTSGAGRFEDTNPKPVKKEKPTKKTQAHQKGVQ